MGREMFNERIEMKKLLMLLVLPALLIAGCGPVELEQSVDVQPDETAFLIMIEETGKQGKFKSEEYLEEHKVAAARILLPLRVRSTGRMWWSYEWIPTARVIRVKRAPVTREWTDDPNTGTESKAQKLAVESLDSVGFSVGATIMARITEEQAAKFLYNFNGQQLEEIIDTNVRGFCLKELSAAFGMMKLEDCKLKKTTVFRDVEKAVIVKFNTMGITIDYFGASEGLTYDDPKIQDSINKQVQAEADIETAKQEKLAQDERNKTLLAKRQADSEAKTAEAKEDAIAATIRNQTKIAAAKAAKPKHHEAVKTDAEEFTDEDRPVVPEGRTQLNVLS